MKKNSIFLLENTLVSLLKANNKGAFEYLYDHYSASLFGIVCKIVKDEEKANDVMQEAFLKIWRNIAAYEESKGTLFTWMLNVTRNTAIDALHANVKHTHSND
jgi:RNA polymerase sigma factor (sigma-70 family)